MHLFKAALAALATAARFHLITAQSSAGGGGAGGTTGNGPTSTTPSSLVTCEPASFTVSGGTAPYFLAILPGGQSTAAPLENLPNAPAAGPVTWVADLPAGTSVTIQVKDSTGAIGFSDQVTIQAGNDNSCVNAAASGASSAVASATSQASSAASRATSLASSAASAASSAGSAATSAASSATSAARSALSSASSAASSASAAAASASNTQKAGVGQGISKPSVLMVGGVLTSLFVGALGGIILL